MEPIYSIEPFMLRGDFLHTTIYPDLSRTLYWSHSWNPGFYVDLAHAGFISIAHSDPELGAVLIPEMQRDYAVLDWEELHCSRKLARLMRSERLAEEEIELRIADSLDRVLERLVAHHQPTWILEPYADLMRRLAEGSDFRIAIHAVELWSRKRDELVAGELGYTIGRIYTSLSGFCSPQSPELRHFGTLQMYLLAGMLEQRGYSFWNMGHPSPPYKKAIGAQILPREEFLERWIEQRDRVPIDRLRGQLSMDTGAKAHATSDATDRHRART